jgi:uncharacterized damage-inducible protein DinB
MSRGPILSAIAATVCGSIPPAEGESPEIEMKLTDFFLAQLDREAAITRLALERVPEGHNNWKPHPKSMPLGYLAALVATMPAWIVTMVRQDELDLQSPGAARFKPLEWRSRSQLLATLEQGRDEAREALHNTTDAHLLTPWKFVVGGHVASENPRYIMIADAVFSHLAHHRGQLTVYLRLNAAPVPALYGPSADEGSFGSAPPPGPSLSDKHAELRQFLCNLVA